MGIFGNTLVSNAAVLTDTISFININTLFGVVTVLAILLLIALIYLGNIMSILKRNSNSANIGPVDKAVIQTAGNEQVELAGNNELVAVITAAIYASMGDSAPADGFVVRSIRRAR